MIRSTSAENTSGLAWALCIGMGILGVFYTVHYFILSIPRLLYPYEIEWMEGSMLDQAYRLFQGKQLYAAPSIISVNWQYQPLYYYAVSGAMFLFGPGFFAGRIISFLSICLSAVIIFLIVRKETSSFWYAFIGISLFFASYGLSGYWYEMARVDSLMLLFLLASLAAITFIKGLPALLFSALFITLAFFTKQSALVFAAPIFLWLLLSGKRNAFLYALFVVIFVACGILYFSLSNEGGWYYYYVFFIPGSMGSTFQWDKIWMVLPTYLFSPLAAGTILLFYFWIHFADQRQSWFKSTPGLLTFITIVAVMELGIYLGHRGAYKNAVMPLSVSISLLLPLLAYHLQAAKTPLSSYLAPALLFIQLGGLYYNFQNVPLVRIGQKEIDAARAFFAEVEAIPGNVFFPQHGFFSSRRKIFVNELAAEECRDANDTAAKRFWTEWEHAFAEKKYDAIILDEGLFRLSDSIPGYEFARNVNMGNTPFRTRAADALSIPRYLYLPKK